MSRVNSLRRMQFRIQQIMKGYWKGIRLKAEPRRVRKNRNRQCKSYQLQRKLLFITIFKKIILFYLYLLKRLITELRKCVSLKNP